MKLLKIIALALCIYPSTIQSHYVIDYTSPPDNYTKGAMTGTMVTGTAVLIAAGIMLIRNAREINHQAAHGNRESTEIVNLHQAADHYFSQGINALAMGSVLGLATALGFYTHLLIPTSKPIKS
jgi:hypothetical protein